MIVSRIFCQKDISTVSIRAARFEDETLGLGAHAVDVLEQIRQVVGDDLDDVLLERLRRAEVRSFANHVLGDVGLRPCSVAISRM